MEDDKDIIEVQKVEDTNNNGEDNVKKVEVVQEKKEDSKDDKKGLCIASMVLGIISIVLFCIWYISVPCSILAIIFGILGMKSSFKGMAIAGIITGALGILFTIVIFVGAFLLGVTIGILENI